MIVSPETLQAVKLALRISGADFDDEVTDIVGAALFDLRRAGVLMLDEGDPLIKRAITLYAKAHFGYSEDSEKYQRSYEMLAGSLALAGDYNALE